MGAQRKVGMTQQKYTLPDLEDYLRSTLRPVKPRTAFVSDLRARLAKVPPAVRATPPILKYTALAIAGAVGGAVIVITGVRAVVTVLGALGLLVALKEQAHQKQGASVRLSQ
jgi:hypothetical protein